MGVSTSVSALIEQSRTLERSGDIAAAFQAARQALSFAQASREAESIAAALTCLGFIYYRNGDFDQARRLADQALSQAAPEIYAHVDAQILLGSIAIDTDDLDGGERYFRRAIDLARLQGYHRALARALHNLASGVYAPRGQFALALATDEEAVRIAAARDLPPSPFPYMTMAWIHLTTGQMESARAVCAELARLARWPKAICIFSTAAARCTKGSWSRR